MLLRFTDTLKWRNFRQRAKSVKDFKGQGAINDGLMMYIKKLEDQVMELERRLDLILEVNEQYLVSADELKDALYEGEDHEESS